MPDIFSPGKRSEIMKKIGPKDSEQELFVRKLVHSMGYRYRLHVKNLPGTPDIVFPKYRKVLFVNGCFWHGHKGCKKSRLPETNREFWEKKIEYNRKNDKTKYRELKKSGWDYMVIWQCEIKKKNIEKLKNKIEKFLKK